MRALIRFLIVYLMDSIVVAFILFMLHLAGFRVGLDRGDIATYVVITSLLTIQYLLLTVPEHRDRDDVGRSSGGWGEYRPEDRD